MMKASGAALLFFVSCTSIVLSGCAGIFKEPPGITYAKSVTQMGIHPVYPPREDLQVGDIYGIEVNDRVESTRLRSVHVDSVDLTSTIKRFLQRRYTFADTKETKVASDTIIGIVGGRLPQQVDAQANSEVIAYSDMQALPITGFPAIEVDTGMSIGVQAAPQGLAAVLGFSAAKTTKMQLQFGSVTSYSVPIPLAYDALLKHCTPVGGVLPNPCNPEKLKMFIEQKYQSGSGSVKNALPLMVSKVYLARAISYTFNDVSLAAAAASIAGEEGKDAPALIDGKLLEEAVNKGNDSAALVRALADYQRSLNDTTNANKGTSGVSVSVAAVSRTSVTFKEIYQRPVVIGYEAVYIEPYSTYWGNK